MKIWKVPFGETREGYPASKYFMENKNGTVAVVSDFGVTLLAFCFAGKDLVLGYDNLRDYETHDRYFGATVGRFAGPVPDGKLQIGDTVYQLTRNDEGNHLHGGFAGFTFRLWDSEILEDGIRFNLTSFHGEEGFPGNLKVSVLCRLTEDDSLHYIYDAVSDRDTVLNMTCHAYFNLEGHAHGSALDHVVHSPARYYRVETPAGVPKPELFAVEQTPFDFTRAHTFGRDLYVPHPQLDTWIGYDRNGYLGEDGVWKLAARVYAPVSGISLEVRTTQTGMQLFCPGRVLDGQHGKDNTQYQPYGAFCIETQHCLSPQEAERGILNPVLKAGQPYHCETTYHFTRLEENPYEI